MTVASTRVAGSIELLRILKNKPLHVRPDRRRPTPLAFDPSSADLAHLPVRVSVWDVRITLARAVALRGGGELVAYSFLTADVARISADLANQRLQVVEDPEGAVGCEAHEAALHCGIEGLEKSAWADRVVRQDALARLAEACRLAE